MGTRERIVEAAYRCFSQKGYLGATTREIARLAGVSEVTLFRYFKSKRELFEKVLKKFSVIPDIERISAESSLPPEEKLRKVAKEILLSLKGKRNFIRILLSEVSLYEEEIAEIYEKFIERLDSIVAQILKTDKETARLFHSSLFGYFLSEEIFLRREINEKEAKEVINKLVEIFTGCRSEKNC
ncbi:TetR/AcrR family transcriptional regulator [Thermovibrio sp.]